MRAAAATILLSHRCVTANAIAAAARTPREPPCLRSRAPWRWFESLRYTCVDAGILCFDAGIPLRRSDSGIAAAISDFAAAISGIAAAKDEIAAAISGIAAAISAGAAANFGAAEVSPAASEVLPTEAEVPPTAGAAERHTTAWRVMSIAIVVSYVCGIGATLDQPCAFMAGRA